MSVTVDGVTVQPFVPPQGAAPWLEVRDVAEPRRETAWRDAAHRVAAGLLLATVAPLLLVLAVAVRLTDGGPALFRQTRVGRDGREFTLLKFRTMRVGADEELETLLPHNHADGPLFKLRDDPRVTSVGSLLRRFSLDELPQLLNVVRGEMALVGPRPPLPREVEHYDALTWQRLAVRPGLTGLWQVSGRSDLSWAESLERDLHYVWHRSLPLDLAIVARTFGAVLSGRGAY